MTATVAVQDNWQRAMVNAIRDGVKAERVNERVYITRRTSCPIRHIVTLNTEGKIESCDCEGWARFEQGRAEGKELTPCKHAAAVARRILRERFGRNWVALSPAAAPRDNGMVEGPRTTRHTLYRSEVA